MDTNPVAPVELYDLDLDIGERTDLAKEYPEITEQMEQIMEKEHTYSEEFSYKYEQ